MSNKQEQRDADGEVGAGQAGAVQSSTNGDDKEC